MRDATCSHFLCFPLRESLLRCCQASAASRVARSADRGLFKTSPYVAASPCLKKFSKLHFSAKIVRRYAASPWGEAPPRGGGEGRILFSIRIFSIKWRNLFALPLAFPFGESGGEAADRGLFKISPYVASFPLLSPSGLTLPNCRSMQSQQVWRAPQRR